MKWNILKEPPSLPIGFAFLIGVIGYLLGFAIFFTGSLVMAGKESSTQPILVFIFNLTVRPFVVLAALGPWAIGFGWALLLVGAVIAKRLVALTILLCLVAFAALTTVSHFPKVFFPNNWNAVVAFCTFPIKTFYLFVLPSLILISAFLCLVFFNRKNT